MATLNREYTIPSSLSAIRGVVDEVRELLSSEFAVEDDDVICLILREGLANAIKHGNKQDQAKQVHLSVVVDARHIRFSIEDQGDGFDPNSIDNPLASENLLKPSGRGIFLMRQFADEIVFNNTGNRVEITIHRQE